MRKVTILKFINGLTSCFHTHQTYRCAALRN